MVAEARGLDWDAEYAWCVACFTQRRDRPHVAYGLCVACFADWFGELGLNDVPGDDPAWGEREGLAMVASASVSEATAGATAVQCGGWYDDREAHHPCPTPGAAVEVRGRCARCYSREYRANGKVRHLPGAGVAAVPVVEPVAEPVEARGRGCVGWLDGAGTWHQCLTPAPYRLDRDQLCPTCAQSAREVARAIQGALAGEAGDAPAQPVADLRAAALALGGREPEVAPTRAAEPFSRAAQLLEPMPVLADDADDAGDDDAAAAEAPEFAWVLFDQSPHVTTATVPIASINKDGDCRLNGPAVALWGQREVLAVEVLYDRARRAIGLRPCDPARAHARRLRADKCARQLSLRGFRSAVGLLPETAGVRATPRVVGEVLVIELG